MALLLWLNRPILKHGAYYDIDFFTLIAILAAWDIGQKNSLITDYLLSADKLYSYSRI